ncbi:MULTISPECIES: HAMP domain-containing sensor histidine kinase [unclassified Paenibacillus]|uniref:sensor histidine kinase n=1 Tax=unclassified Paenibacillus TaxID=185978 RepID=UPI0024B8D4A9|nr:MULTISPECIES: sensor histidine kinase [unclassified Paenibacillus]
MRKGPKINFIRDRFIYIGLYLIVIALGVGFMLLEKAHQPGRDDMGSIPYFIILSSFLLISCLIFDYIRQRRYYAQLRGALERSDELQATIIVQSSITSEQRMITFLLEQQYNAYMNELHNYRRQQEMHNHFVMQWVHQMKTPLSVIDLLAQEMIRQKYSKPVDMKQLSLSVQEETERMTSGLEMMLYTARLNKFEIDLHLRTTALHELIRSVINAHKRLCIRNSIFPSIDGEMWIETDEKWMTFVLNQFVSNAIKYSKSKSGNKTLKFWLKDNGMGGGILRVTDEGIGIADYDLPRIFDAFFTGENGRMAGESTGMGLYLAKEVCTRLGHGLSVTSVLGKGTTFTITFENSGIHMIHN